MDRESEIRKQFKEMNVSRLITFIADKPEAVRLANILRKEKYKCKIDPENFYYPLTITKPVIT